MRRAWKILIGVLAVFVVLVGGAVAYVLNIDANAYKGDIEQLVREETGRELTIGGPIKLDIGAETVVEVSDVKFANAEWGSRPEMATVGRAEVALRLIPTIFGTPDITRVRLSGVDALIERNAEGASNTAIGPPDEAPSEDADAGEADLGLPVLRDVRIEDVTLRVRDMQAGTENTVRLNRLTLAGEGPDSPLDLDMDGAFDDLPLVLTGTLGPPGAMLDSGTRWDVDVTGNLAGVDVALNGGIMEPTAGRGIDLHAKALGDELAEIAHKVGIDAPQVGRFEVRADVAGDADGDLAVNDITVDIGSREFVHVAVGGRIASATKVAGLDLDVTVEGAETARLSALTQRFAGQEVPALGPYRIATRVTGGLDKGIAVTGLNAEIGKAEQLAVTAKGGIADVVSAAGLDVTASVATPDLAALNKLAAPYIDQEIPDLGPLDAKARLVGDLPVGGQAGKMAVQDIDVTLGRAETIRVTARGGMADAMAARGLDLELTATSEEIGRLDSLARTYTGGQGVPELGPLDLAMALHGDVDGQLGVRNLDLDFGREDTLKVAANGSIEDVHQGAGADLTFRLASPNLGLLSEAAGTEIPEIGPVEVDGALRAGADEPLRLAPFEATIGDSDLVGELTADLRGEVPNITARMNAEHFDTADLTGGDSGTSGASEASGTGTGPADTGPPHAVDSEEDGERLIPNTPLPFEALKTVTANIRFTAGKLIAQQSEFDDFELSLLLQEGKLTVDTLKAGVGQGTLDATFSLDGGQKPAPMTLKAVGDKLGLSALGGAAGLKDRIDGPLDLEIDLKGRGNTPREIAGSLDGVFSAVVADSRVKREAVREALGDDMTRLSDLLFGQQGEWVVVNCAVLDYEVADGVMDAKAGFIDTDVSTVTSDGTIDLKTEEISMGVKPQAAMISIPLLVTGRLSSPTVIPDPGKTLLSVGGALLTGGGLTAALAVLSATLPESHPCMSTAQAAKKEAAEQESKSTGEKAIEAPGDALRGLQGGVDELGKGLNKLLGQ